MSAALLAGEPIEELSKRARSSPIRWSHLHRLLDSPRHYLSGFAEPQEDKVAMRIGRVVDAYVLRGEHPVVFQGSSRSGDKWDRFEAKNRGREILTVSENDRARFAADSIEASSVAMEVLAGTIHPEIEWWRNSRLHQAHPDVVGYGASFITEIKVTHTAKPAWFVPIAVRLGYPVQLAMYDEAVAAKKVRQRSEQIGRFIVAVEHESPFITTVFRLRERSMSEARERLAKLYALLDRCERSNEWGGYDGLDRVREFDTYAHFAARAEDFERVG